MKPDASNVVVVSRLCSACNHVNTDSVDTCAQCGSALGGPKKQEPSLVDAAVSRETWAVLGVESDLIGRESEIDQIVARVSDAFDTGTSLMVHIAGEEGIGKSRLTDALDAAIQNHTYQGLILHARASGSERGPYAVFAEVLRSRFYIPRDAAQSIVRRRFEEGVATMLGPGSLETAHRVGALIGIKYPGSPWSARSADGEASARRSLMKLLRKDASGEPIVLVFDDAHLAGSESLQLIGEIYRELADAPIVIVLTGPSADTLEACGVSPEEPRVETVTLKPLGDEDMERLVRNLLCHVEELPTSLITTLTERAVGNPLKAEELLRILVTDGAIVASDDAWQVHTDVLDRIDLPVDFTDVIEKRVAQLDDEDRAFLGRAALVGQAFWLGAMITMERLQSGPQSPDASVWDDRGPTQRVLDRLDSLSARDVIRARPKTTLPFDREFAFKHAAECRVLIEGVPAEEQRKLHYAIGQWMDQTIIQDRDNFLARIAKHYAQAGVTHRAADLYAEAGHQARAHYANDRATRYFERALELFDEDDVASRLEVLNALGTLYDLAGEHERAIPIFESLAVCAWSIGSRSKGGVAFNKLGRVRTTLGRYDDALVDLKRAMELFTRVDDQRGIASCLDNIGRIHWIRGAYDRAQEHYARALDKRRKLEDDRSVALTLSNIGMLLVHRGRFADGLEHFREALELRRTVGDLRGIAQSLNAIGVIFHERGEAQSAIDLWREALETAEEAGDRQLVGMLLNNMGEAKITIGELEEAEELLRTACEISEESGERRLLFDAVRNLGVLQGRKGNYSLAIDHVEEALEMARELGAGTMEGIALRTLAELQGQTLFDTTQEGSSDSAQENFQRSIAIFEALGNDSELGRTYHALGTLMLEQGLLLQGKQHLEMAKDIFERLEMRRVLAETQETIHAL